MTDRRGKEFALYLINGTAAYLVFVGSMEGLYAITYLPKPVASVIAWLAAALTSYVLHYFVTFRSDAKHLAIAPRFVGLLVAGAVLSATILPWAVVDLGLTPWLAATAYSAGWSVLSFLSLKLWVFSR